MKTTSKRGIGIVILTVGLLTVGSAWRSADAGNPGLISTEENVFGNTYGEWAARWVQWLLSIPADTNPALDTTGARCAERQAGPVWFLAGNFGGPVSRTCTVPAGKALFFPLDNVLFGAGAFDCTPTTPDVVCNLASLRVGASAAMDPANVKLATTLDGKNFTDLTDQRVQPPVILVTYPENSLFGIPAGTYNPNVDDGYWLMLAPLKAGVHTLSFSAEVIGGPFAGTSVGPVNYTLTISP
jgi:hypothetical protein